MIERLESRTLFSTIISVAGTYTGMFHPYGRAARAAFGGAHVAATLTLTVDTNSAITGTLSFGNIATDNVSGGSVGTTAVNLTLISNGSGIGTFTGKFNKKGKRLIGPLNETFQNQIVKGKLVLTRSKSTSKSSVNTNNLQLAPGYTPNVTPPPITNSFNNTTPITDQVGLTNGQTSGNLLSNPSPLLG